MSPLPLLLCLCLCLLLCIPPSHTHPAPPTYPDTTHPPGYLPPPHNPIPFNRQQAPPLNNCSNLPQPCGPFICCPTTCCPEPFTICPPTPISPFCLTPSLQTPCLDPVSNATFPGTPCNVARSRCCGAAPGFDFCADDQDDIACVDEDGFIPCGEPPLPGVNCEGGVCCQNPTRCCQVAGETMCCVVGDGEPLELRPEVSFEGELIMGVPGEPVDIVFGLGSVEPTMEIEEETEQPVDSLEPQVSLEPEMSLEAEESELPEIIVAESFGPLLIGEESVEAEESMGAEASVGEGELETVAASVEETVEAEMSIEAEASVGVLESEGDEEGEDDGSVCFGGDAKVEVKGVGMREMREVRAGDWVRVGEEEWEEVMMWSHWDLGYEGRRYVRVVLEGGDGVKTSEGHVVWVWECEKGCERRGVRVEEVELGMWMWVVGVGLRRVVGVERAVWGKGMLNPQTASGDIVVDGVVVSCYTKWVAVGVAHGLLAPVRAVWAVGSWY